MIQWLVTLKRYCYSSTAVPLAVPFFGCLLQLASARCSYIRTEMPLCLSCQAFPEVLLVQRAGLRGILEGVKGRSPLVPLRPIFFFFFQPLFFCRIIGLFCVWSDTHCPLSCSPHTLPPHTKIWGSVPHIPISLPAPSIGPSATLTPSKASATRVTFSFFASSQAQHCCIWGSYSPIARVLTCGRCPINPPAPLH